MVTSQCETCRYCGYELLPHETVERRCGFLCDVCVRRVGFEDAERVEPW